jgi:hypothetical protein
MGQERPSVVPRRAEVIPDDPTLVAIGDTVTIRLGDGNEETYVLVDAAEAAIDDRRISFDSPSGVRCSSSRSERRSRWRCRPAPTTARSSGRGAPRPRSRGEEPARQGEREPGRTSDHDRYAPGE